MTTQKEQAAEIVQDIMNHIKAEGGNFARWYVGITARPRIRLFDEHRVKEKTDRWIYRPATSHTVARAVEEYFIKKKGTQGGGGGGDSSSKYVYAYKTSLHTDEDA